MRKNSPHSIQRRSRTRPGRTSRTPPRLRFISPAPRYSVGHAAGGARLVRNSVVRPMLPSRLVGPRAVQRRDVVRSLPSFPGPNVGMRSVLTWFLSISPFLFFQITLVLQLGKCDLLTYLQEAKNNVMPETNARRTAKQLLQAVAHCHSHGVRDISTLSMSA